MTAPLVPVPSVLTCATFTPLIGEPFDATRDGASATLSLIEAKPIPLKPMDGRAIGKSGFVRRDPFVLLLRGPIDRPLLQGLHRFRHAALGEFEMGIVPVGYGETGLLYEAVFN